MNPKHEEFIKKLRAARELLQKGWTRDAWAKTRSGIATDPGSPQATCWCLGGALRRAGIGYAYTDYRFVDGKRMISVVIWNDSLNRTKAQVLACIDNSIAALQTAA